MSAVASKAWHGIAQCWSPSSGRSGEEEKQAKAGGQGVWWVRFLQRGAGMGMSSVYVLPLLGYLGNLG
jgi:hypothetical protein